MSCTASVNAQEKLQMQGTEITGNKELPKVLYIVALMLADAAEARSPTERNFFLQRIGDVVGAEDREEVVVAGPRSLVVEGQEGGVRCSLIEGLVEGRLNSRFARASGRGRPGFKSGVVWRPQRFLVLTRAGTS